MANMVAVPNNVVVGIIFYVHVFVSCFLPTVLSAGYLQKLYLPDPGPESFAFDLKGQGPYTGVADGRIFKYKGPILGFVEYGYTNPNR